MQRLLVEEESFVDAGMWDEVQMEIAPFVLNEGVRVPTLKNGQKVKTTENYQLYCYSVWI